MSTVLVTGGSGLIGWPTTEALAGMGHTVVVYDVRPNAENLAGFDGPGTSGKVSVVAGDVGDLPRLLGTMRRHAVDHVIHLAAVIAENLRFEPASAFRVNTGGTANVFDAALAVGVKRVVWTSSVTAVSVGADYANEPVDEDYRMASAGAYGASKYAAEVMAGCYRRDLGLDVIGIRPALTYGLGRFGGGAGLFNSAVRRMAQGAATGVPGSASLHQTMYNRDMAAFLIAALFGPRPEHHLFNTPVERDYDDAALLAVLRRVCPEVAIHIDPIPDYIPKVPVMDGARARREIAFAPRYVLEDGVREMVDFFRRPATGTGAAR